MEFEIYCDHANWLCPESKVNQEALLRRSCPYAIGKEVMRVRTIFMLASVLVAALPDFVGPAFAQHAGRHVTLQP